MWCGCVLILILLEDTLWVEVKNVVRNLLESVLILILLEDTLWGVALTLDKKVEGVLILILLEDTLWGQKRQKPINQRISYD